MIDQHAAILAPPRGTKLEIVSDGSAAQSGCPRNRALRPPPRHLANKRNLLVGDAAVAGRMLGPRDHLDVIRVDASLRLTAMVRDFSFWDASISTLVKDDVCGAISPTIPEQCVSVSVNPSLPQPAAGVWINDVLFDRLQLVVRGEIASKRGRPSAASAPAESAGIRVDASAAMTAVPADVSIESTISHVRRRAATTLTEAQGNVTIGVHCSVLLSSAAPPVVAATRGHIIARIIP